MIETYLLSIGAGHGNGGNGFSGVSITWVGMGAGADGLPHVRAEMPTKRDKSSFMPVSLSDDSCK